MFTSLHSLWSIIICDPVNPFPQKLPNREICKRQPRGQEGNVSWLLWPNGGQALSVHYLESQALSLEAINLLPGRQKALGLNPADLAFKKGLVFSHQ